MESKDFKLGKLLINGEVFDPSVGIKELRLVPKDVLKLYSNLKYILNDARNTKEKNPNQLRKTYKDNHGRKIKVLLADFYLDSMEEYIKKLEKEWRLAE